MIRYADVRRGDVLRMVKAIPDPVPGFQRGDLVRVTAVHSLGVFVENRDGQPCEFVYQCGAAYLEPTQWRDDFPEEQHKAAI